MAPPARHPGVLQEVPTPFRTDGSLNCGRGLHPVLAWMTQTGPWRVRGELLRVAPHAISPLEVSRTLRQGPKAPAPPIPQRLAKHPAVEAGASMARCAGGGENWGRFLRRHSNVAKRHLRSVALGEADIPCSTMLMTCASTISKKSLGSIPYCTLDGSEGKGRKCGPGQENGWFLQV